MKRARERRGTLMPQGGGYSVGRTAGKPYAIGIGGFPLVWEAWQAGNYFGIGTMRR